LTWASPRTRIYTENALLWLGLQETDRYCAIELSLFSFAVNSAPDDILRGEAERIASGLSCLPGVDEVRLSNLHAPCSVQLRVVLEALLIRA
jgi:hypothetical protein